MSDLYRDNILDNYERPRNYGSLKKPDISVTDENPLCGDCLTFDMKCAPDGTITDIAFTAKGCALSVASASILSESVKGKKADEVLSLDHDDIEKLLEARIGPGRIKCALLPLAALRKAVSDLRAQRQGKRKPKRSSK